MVGSLFFFAVSSWGMTFQDAFSELEPRLMADLSRAIETTRSLRNYLMLQKIGNEQGDQSASLCEVERRRFLVFRPQLIKKGGQKEILSAFEVRDKQFLPAVVLRGDGLEHERQISWKLEERMKISRIYPVSRQNPLGTVKIHVCRDFFGGVEELLFQERYDGDIYNTSLLKDAPTALKIFRIISAVLVNMHELQVVHGDVKESNILYRWSGGELEIALTDFGLSFDSVRDALVSVGTSGYEAPEVLQMQADVPLSGYRQMEVAALLQKRDIYAFGIAAFHTFFPLKEFPDKFLYLYNACGQGAGRAPCLQRKAHELYARLHAYAEKTCSYGPCIYRTIARALTVSVEDRPTARELLREMQSLE